jgi:hypothetical protein
MGGVATEKKKKKNTKKGVLLQDCSFWNFILSYSLSGFSYNEIIF